MNDVVFILGAGASATSGVPLMANFLDRARDLLTVGKVEDVKEQFELVFKGISRLQQVHSKANIDIHNVEAVFSAFEMAKLLGSFGAFQKNEIDALVEAMPTMIARTVEQTMMLDVERQELQGFPLAPRDYRGLAELVEQLLGHAKLRRQVTLLSFNYDVGLEVALEAKGLPFTYGLDRADSGLAVLKLHGSVAWFRCNCQGTYVYPLSRYPWDNYALRRFSKTPMRFSHVPKDSHCQNGELLGPLIVPPIWNKTRYYEEIANVWNLAAERLKTAESIVSIGYSLPETDAFFRYLYALGSVGETPLRRFWVVNRDDSKGPTAQRFRSLLGPGAENRFDYFQNTFEEFLALPRVRDKLEDRSLVYVEPLLLR